VLCRATPGRELDSCKSLFPLTMWPGDSSGSHRGPRGWRGPRRRPV